MKKIYLTLLLTISLTFNYFSQITTTVNPSSSDIINYLQGVGLTITNMTVTAAPGSLALYSGSSSMAFGNGIMMSTGIIDSTINNPSSYFLSTMNGTSGDPDLNNISISGSGTQDACILEFDCIPSNANLLFNFSFGSEEYNEYVGSINDVFAIFVSGPNPLGGNYTNSNFALVPGTSIPVSINTVNNGSAMGTATGPCTNCSYYIDNAAGLDVAYDGFTAGLQGLVSVIPGQSYHFKIAIGDEMDNSFDSSVMFLANSFKSAPSGTAGIFEAEKENDLIVYPNPSLSLIQIKSKNNTIHSVELFSCDGKQIDEIGFDKNTNTINLNGTVKGIYFLHVTTSNGKTVKKVVID